MSEMLSSCMEMERKFVHFKNVIESNTDDTNINNNLMCVLHYRALILCDIYISPKEVVNPRCNCRYPNLVKQQSRHLYTGQAMQFSTFL